MLVDTIRHPLPPQTLEHFWSLEDIGIRDNCYQDDDETALQIFKDTVQFENERYFAKWPWKSEHPDLPDNYGLAYGTLKSLLKRLQDNKDLIKAYDDTIQDQLQKGIIEEAPEDPTGIVHYIPHHGVLNPLKTATKLRIVYDASAKMSKDSLSLNECLYRGPVFLPAAVGLILRWRLPKIAIISDIEKAFLQIGLQQTEKEVTRFLWLKDPGKDATASNIRTLRFCRVAFGVISSPFILAATVVYHLAQIGGPVAMSIEKNIYVDNVFGVAASVEEATKYYTHAKQIFAKAAMNLREWFSNSDAFLSSISAADRGQGATTSVLGLKWNLKEDSFNIAAGAPPNEVIIWTKRRILQYVVSVFDPCGYFSPVTIRGKLTMQQLWKDKYGWDDNLPDGLVKTWRTITEDIAQIPCLNLPRKLTLSIRPDSCLQLHCFCDASTRAHSAAIYLRNQTGEFVCSNLMFAKSRVAPIKPISVPRLELLAVLIGTRMLKFVEQRSSANKEQICLDGLRLCFALDCQTGHIYCVCKNRLAEIRAATGTYFKHVPTSENPADMPSRGIEFAVMRESSTWWSGPQWLRKSICNWPTQPEILCKPAVPPEQYPSQPCLATPQKINDARLMDIERY